MAATGLNARPAGAEGEARDSWVAEVLAWRPKAERGDVEAQVALAELFMGRQQLVEGVHWYRLAATNGDVTAQLGLAGCLIAGRGAVEDRQEAAYWIRRAADGVERGAHRVSAAAGTQPTPPGTSLVPPGSGRSSFARAEVGGGAGALGPAGAAGAAAGKNLFTNGESHSTPSIRRDTLSPIESRTQDSEFVLQPFELPK